MTEYIHLIGSEEVSRAGVNMSHAAESMQRSVQQFDFSVDRLQRILEEHAQRIEEAMKENPCDR